MELGLNYVLKSVVALVVIIFSANYGLKYLNTFMTKKNQVIKVIERTPISKSSALSIVEIADTYYLMSFTDTRNEILRELTAEEKAKITTSIEEVVSVTQLKPKKVSSGKKDIQTFKDIQSQYQYFYEKRK